MFYITINNKKMKDSSNRIYQYENYINARNMKYTCYGSTHNNVKIMYQNDNNKIKDIEKLLNNILTNYNTNKSIKLSNQVSIDNNIIYIDTNKIGRLQQGKNGKWVIFDM